MFVATLGPLSTMHACIEEAAFVCDVSASCTGAAQDYINLEGQCGTEIPLSDEIAFRYYWSDHIRRSLFCFLLHRNAFESHFWCGHRAQDSFDLIVPAIVR